MIKMAKLTEYAFMVLMTLKKSRDPLSADTVACCVGLETTTVSKILKQLKKAGMLDSKRGATGGYFLIERQQDISLHDVICAMEGDVALTECIEDDSACHIAASCHMSSGLKRVNDVIMDALKAVTVDEIMDQPNTLSLEIKS